MINMESKIRMVFLDWANKALYYLALGMASKSEAGPETMATSEQRPMTQTVLVVDESG